MITDFADTLADIARNLATLWPWAIVALIALAAWLLLTFPLAISIGRAFKEGGEEFAAEDDARLDRLDRLLALVESPEPLPPIDATEAEFEAWAMRAVGIANDRSYDRTLAEIRALPTKEAS